MGLRSPDDGLKPLLAMLQSLGLDRQEVGVLGDLMESGVIFDMDDGGGAEDTKSTFSSV